MEVFLARQTLKQKPEKISLEQIKEKMKDKVDEIFYFDNSNTHKSMLALIAELEKDYSVNFNEVKYKPADEDYIYQMHLIK